jgi:hypothetical protein
MTHPKDPAETMPTEPPKQKMWRKVFGWLLKVAVGQLIAYYVRHWTA